MTVKSFRGSVFIDQNQNTSPRWARAFLRGAGGSIGTEYEAGHVAMFGSPRYEKVLKNAECAGFDWYYGDHGFFSRGIYYRCARNVYMHDGLSGDDNADRFQSFRIPIREWRSHGEHIVVCPNSQAFLDRRGSPNWVAETIASLKKYTDRPIRVRWKKDASAKPLARDLEKAWAAVTFMSNASVESALAGVPVFCSAPCAGLSMGSGDLSKIETPALPDGRDAWASRLANNQWTLEEMASGMLWAAIGR